MREHAPLVLSLFPGIGLLDMAFEEEGFCVVRGPDLLWGGDVKRFHPPAGKFDGVIGGDPCQHHSPLANIVRATHGEASVAPDMTPEYERIINESLPVWYLRENSPHAPTPRTPGYITSDIVLNNRLFGSSQSRKRRFWLGTVGGRRLSAGVIAASVGKLSGMYEPAVCSTSGGRRVYVAIGGSGKPKGNQGASPDALLRKRTFAQECELQGLPADFLCDAPFTLEGKRRVIGNGVPLPMGRAIAKAVKRAMYPEWCEAFA